MLKSDIEIDLSKSGCNEEAVELGSHSAQAAKNALLLGNGKGSEFLGWVNWPISYKKKEVRTIKNIAEKIQEDSDILIVIGIGGSYLGAKAAIDFMEASLAEEAKCKVYFVGNSISSDAINKLKAKLKGKDFSINVISKSGTTMEPAIAFRIFKKLLIEKYGEKEAARRIYATTDSSSGALKKMAEKNGYQTFDVPDDIGGRYSVLTPVGLLPIAVNGVDIEELLQGAADMRMICMEESFENNPALIYATIRHSMIMKRKSIEILCSYSPRIHSLAEWWKQLFGESEGKDGKGLFPVCLDFTTDLHSIGQFIQDGSRVMFETVLFCEQSSDDITIEAELDNLDELSYLEGKTLDFINKCAMQGTAEAHFEGGTPNVIITFKECNAHTLGELFYFFEFACGVSGYMLGVNPFNQPGVDFYKNNMFKLLGKPGY